jgi:hypothetical protein
MVSFSPGNEEPPTAIYLPCSPHLKQSILLRQPTAADIPLASPYRFVNPRSPMAILLSMSSAPDTPGRFGPGKRRGADLHTV